MNIDIQFNQADIVMKNHGSDTQTVPYGGNNALTLPNGAVVNPPPNSYWHIASVTGGAHVDPSASKLTMPGGSTATWNVDG